MGNWWPFAMRRMVARREGTLFLYFFTQFIAESGKASLFLNHALPLPAPF